MSVTVLTSDMMLTTAATSSATITIDSASDEYAVNFESEDKQLLADRESTSRKKSLLNYIARKTCGSRKTRDGRTKTKHTAVSSKTVSDRSRVVLKPDTMPAKVNTAYGPTRTADATTCTINAPSCTTYVPTCTTNAPTCTTNAPTGTTNATTCTTNTPTCTTYGLTHTTYGPNHTTYGPNHTTYGPIHTIYPSSCTTYGPSHTTYGLTCTTNGPACTTYLPKTKNSAQTNHDINLQSGCKQLLTDVKSTSKKQTVLDYITGKSHSSRRTKEGVSKTDGVQVSFDTKKIKKIEGKTKRGKPRDYQEIGFKALTVLCPLRKSRRNPLSEQKNRQQRELEEKIVNNCEEGLAVKTFPGRGRGVIAVRSFMEGEFVVEYKGELLDSTAEMEKRERHCRGGYMYYFIASGKQYCVDATAATKYFSRLLNRSRQANLKPLVVTIGRRPHLVLLAARHIQPFEELLCDCGDRTPETVAAHTWLTQ